MNEEMTNDLEKLRIELLRLGEVADADFATEVHRVEKEMPWVRTYVHWNTETLRQATMRLLAKVSGGGGGVGGSAPGSTATPPDEHPDSIKR
jgi:hypothetical protein